MSIGMLPNEILHEILSFAAQIIEESEVRFTYGLTCLPGESAQQRPHRYIRGAVPPFFLRMDATISIRSVCSKWHHWGLAYAVRDLHIKCWQSSQRWLELPLQRDKYAIYELIEHFQGTPHIVSIRPQRETI